MISYIINTIKDGNPYMTMGSKEYIQKEMSISDQLVSILKIYHNEEFWEALTDMDAESAYAILEDLRADGELYELFVN